jgi:two-component system, NarL family, invasion response regulator UvrY
MPSKTQIALVDDHALFRAGLVELIESFEDFEVLFEAEDGNAFVKTIDISHPPDLILLDITMPRMNGYETAAWIRKNLPAAKVLALSMLDNETAIIRMLNYGAKGYISKDSKPHLFKEALKAVRDQGYYLNEHVTSKMFHLINSRHGSKNGSELYSFHLTDREIVFLKLACTEKTYKEIASEMCVSTRTVDSYRDALFAKLEITSRVGLAVFAIRNGIVVI